MPDIDFQRIVLNLIPKKGDEPVVFYASQYETTRPFIADLMWGETEFAPGDDCWAEIDVRKNDDNLVVITDDVAIDNNEVSVILPVQALTCIGNNLGQVKIYAGEDQLIAALNFILEVQPDPLAGGVTSETAIDNLTEQIKDITQQVIGDDYYDKTEVDDLLDDKADKTEVDDLLDDKADKTTTYTKSEVDAALNLKADKSTTYTKTQTDNLLNDKADKATTYTKTQVDNALALKANASDLAKVATTGDYDDLTNKPTIPAAQVQSDYAQADNTQIDYIKNKPDLSVFVTSDALSEIIYDLLPAGTASGAIANFDTDLSLPLVECKANIVASQASGTPTPSNPIPINGYTEANITRCGVNLWGHNDVTIGIASYVINNEDVYLPEGTYVIQWKFSGTTGAKSGRIDDVDGNAITTFSGGVSVGLNSEIITIPTGKIGVKFKLYSAVIGTYSDFEISIGSTTPEYTPYTGNTYTIVFGQTVYGGVLDVTRGKLKPCIYYPSYNGETLSGRWLSSEATYVEGTTPPIGSQVVSLDDYGVVIDLTPVQINALIGVNNVYNDTNGDTEVKYKDGIQHYIDTRI